MTEIDQEMPKRTFTGLPAAHCPKKGAWLYYILVLSLMLGLSAGLIGCKSTGPKTHTVRKWDDLQKSIDEAETNDIIDLSGLTSPRSQYTLQVAASFNLTLIGNPNEIFVGIAFCFGGENSIRIENLRLAATGNQAASALDFTSWGNQLTVIGDNQVINTMSIEHKGYGAAIGVPEGATLTVSGTGSLLAVGGTNAAGIGGGFGFSAGTIFFRGGTIRAEGGSAAGELGAAGIGGGSGGSGGAVVISGGTVSAIGGRGCAGIGNGSGNSGAATLTISGGDLTVESGGATGSTALSCTIEALPGSYTWWAGLSRSVGTGDGNRFPDWAFVNSSEFHYVHIQVM